MTIDELVYDLDSFVRSEADTDGVDPDQVYNGIVSSYLMASQDQYAQQITGYDDSVDSRYHDIAKRGIMRVTGVTSDDYDLIMKYDPDGKTELRSAYMATI